MSISTSGRIRSAKVTAAVLLGLMLAVWGLGSSGYGVVHADCNSTGSPNVSTDKEDYDPGETVIISGSGYPCGVELTVKVTRPDGTVVVGDGSFAPGSDTVTTDSNGEFTYNYILNGIGGIYTVEVIDGSGAVLATTTFRDSHFRFSHITWRRTSGRTVEFTGTSAWRCCPGASFSFGDGSPNHNLSGPQVGSGTDASGASFVIHRDIFTHTYPSDGPFTAVFSSCCRVGGIVNASGNFKNTVVVDLRSGNDGSPVSSIPVIVQMVHGGVNNVQIPVADPQGHLTSCSLSPPGDTGGSYSVPSAGGNTLSLTPGCLMSWDTSGTTVNQKYTVHVTIEETLNSSQVQLDFFIEIISGTLNQPPTCIVNGAANNVLQVGVPFNLSITGTDPEGGNLTVSHGGLPSGATLGPSSGASPLTTTFSWTPTAGDQGTSHAVTVFFTDIGNFQAFCSFTATVPTALADLTITKSASPNPVTVGGAVTWTVTITNAGPDPATSVVFKDELGPGLVFVSATPSQGGPCTYVTDVICNLGDIGVGGSATITVVTTATAAAAPSTHNHAEVSSNVLDPDTSDNTASDTVSVITNQAPTCSKTIIVIAEDSGVSSHGLPCSDPDNDPISIEIVALSLTSVDPVNVTGPLPFTLPGGSLDLEPYPDFNGNGGSFQFRATDSQGATSGVATATVTVTPVNDPSTISADNDPVTVNEGDTANNSGSYNDIDLGDSVGLTASKGSVSGGGSQSGTWSWSFGTTDGPSESGPVTITADDGNGGTAQVTFQLIVNNVPPTVDAGPDATVDEGDEFSAGAASCSPAGNVVVNPANGHCYEVVSTNVDWNQAKAAAAAMTFGGVQGHLATIADAQENAFIQALLGGATAWVGADQPPPFEVPGPDPNFGAGWQWVTGEPFVYTNWDGGEPNDCACTGSAEDALQFYGSGLWNDLPRGFNLAGYVVEYEPPVGGSFTDPGADAPWTGTVDYGDGTGVQTLAVDSNNKTFNLSHTYGHAGTYTVTVTIKDKDGDSSW